MVFYSRRMHLALKNDKKASLTNLPDELQLQVFGDDKLDTLTLLRLRLTSHSLVPPCNTLLQKRLKILYLHPRSIRRAIDICNHPTFSQHIEEIVLLGRPMWRLPGGLAEHSKSDNRHRAWPFESVQDGSLLKALASLPKLHCLKFAEHVLRPGVNQVSEQTMSAHANKCARSARQMDELRLADGEVIYQLLNVPHLRFSSVCLDTELPFIHHVLNSSNGGPHSLKLALLPFHSGGLTSLHITIDCGWDTGFSRSAKLHRELTENSRETLEQLTITLKSNKAQKKPVPESRLFHILDDLMLSRLRSIEMKLVDTFSSNHVNRRHRPTCQILDIVSFLARHSATLSTVNFHDVIFCDLDWSCATDDLRKAVEQLRHNTVLEQVSWELNEYKHDMRCPRKDGEPMIACSKFACGRYHLSGGNQPEGLLEHFQGLAMELGLELDGERQSWDFGKAVTDLRNIDSLGAGLE